MYIYNIKGEKVRTLINEKKEPGYYEVIWNGKDDNKNSVLIRQLADKSRQQNLARRERSELEPRTAKMSMFHLFSG